MDKINHPSHYNQGKIEVIEFIEDKKLNFSRGNAVKYIARAGKKLPEQSTKELDLQIEIEDLKKARWYVTREIENLEAQLQDRPSVKPNDMADKS